MDCGLWERQLAVACGIYKQQNSNFPKIYGFLAHPHQTRLFKDIPETLPVTSRLSGEHHRNKPWGQKQGLGHQNRGR